MTTTPSASNSGSLTSSVSHGQPIKLHPDISEEDRAFFLVLDIAFSQFYEPSELGYYYECECEDTFTFDRFQTAASHFSYYHGNKGLKPGDKVRAKYVNLSKLVASKTMSEPQAKQIISNLHKEFQLLRCVNSQVRIY